MMGGEINGKQVKFNFVGAKLNVKLKRRNKCQTEVKIALTFNL